MMNDIYTQARPCNRNSGAIYFMRLSVYGKYIVGVAVWHDNVYGDDGSDNVYDS